MQTKTKTEFMVFNYTDGIYATNLVFDTRKQAEQFIIDFRKRYEEQGYYRDNFWNVIPIEDIDLEIIDSKFNPYQ